MKKPNKHTIDELHQWQMLPLSIKVRMSLTRIREWVHEYGEEGVYVSYSGGKDSTVLSHLVDEAFPDNKIPRVFVDTGLEYPEIRQWAFKEPRIVILKPTMNFKKVIEKYGYPFPTKEVSECVDGARKYLTKILNEMSLDSQSVSQSVDTVPLFLRKTNGNREIHDKGEYP